MTKTLLVDVQNIVYKNFYGGGGVKELSDDTIDLAICGLFFDLLKYKKSNSIDKMVLAFDHKISWRKIYTEDLDKCETFKKYKGGRNKNLTEKEKEHLDKLVDKIDDVYTALKKHTALICLKNKLLEADDLIAGYVLLHEEDENITILSSDKDFLQLIRNENIKIVNPYKNGKDRTLDEWNNDPDLFLFEKCIRGEGEQGDNIMSSYPRLWRTKLFEAYYDSYKRNNIMNHKFKFPVYDEVEDTFKDKEFITKKVFQENKILMDLTEGQPEEIKKLIFQSIKKEENREKRANVVQMLRWANKRDYKLLVEDYNKYSEVFINR